VDKDLVDKMINGVTSSELETIIIDSVDNLENSEQDLFDNLDTIDTIEPPEEFNILGAPLQFTDEIIPENDCLELVSEDTFTEINVDNTDDITDIIQSSDDNIDEKENLVGNTESFEPEILEENIEDLDNFDNFEELPTLQDENSELSDLFNDTDFTNELDSDSLSMELENIEQVEFLEQEEELEAYYNIENKEEATTDQKYDIFNYVPEAVRPEKDRILDIIKSIDAKFPDEKIMDVFELKYQKCLSVIEISKELGIMETQVLSALSEIINAIKD
jgi:uncharacterized protein YjaG (DUF416 family)